MDKPMIAHGRAPRMRTAAAGKLAATAALLFNAREAFPDLPVCRGCGLDADHCQCPDGPDTASDGYRAAVEELDCQIAAQGGQLGGHLYSVTGRTVLWSLMADAGAEAEIPGYVGPSLREPAPVAAAADVPAHVVPGRSGYRLVPAEEGR